MTQEQDKFIPKGQPLSAHELADAAKYEEVAITRGDVERAIASADDELKKYLQATQYKQKK